MRRVLPKTRRISAGEIKLPEAFMDFSGPTSADTKRARHSQRLTRFSIWSYFESSQQENGRQRHAYNRKERQVQYPAIPSGSPLRIFMKKQVFPSKEREPPKSGAAIHRGPRQRIRHFPIGVNPYRYLPAAVSVAPVTFFVI